MIRPLAVACALALLTLAETAAAQTYGQPVYLNAWGRPVGSAPSEVDTRTYVRTGRWADGYTDRPRVYVPTPGYRQDSQDDERGRYGGPYRRSYNNVSRPGHDRHSRSGFRDGWGYNDDRPPTARHWSHGGRTGWHGRDCRCGDIYLYDR